jgi:hypothetical protein
MSDLEGYYERCEQMREQYEGKRARITGGNGIGTTGRIEACEDGIGFRMDQPIPAWADEFEDAQTGFLTLGDTFNDMEVIDENFPIHSGDAEVLKPRKA